MTQTIEAVYQNGMFKPLVPVSVDVADGETVTITIGDKKFSPEEYIELGKKVYQGLSDEEIAEIEKIALDRSNLFGDREL
jgi:predicted DNA-binding antitoxin AbrB/MazE fold protein